MRAAIRTLAGFLVLSVALVAVFSFAPTPVSPDAEVMPYAQVVDVPAGVQTEVENIKRFAADAPSDPLDQVLAVYTYFCLNYEYDYTCTYRGVDEIMESGTGLCEAYALAFRFVMDELGIPCAYVEGDTPAVYHAWNAVQLDGQWYWLDPTFDDYKADGYRVNRQYFLKSDEAFLPTHTPRLWYGPNAEREVQACPSTRFDSFWWNDGDVLAHDAVVPYDGGWAYFSRQAGVLVKRGSAAQGEAATPIAESARGDVGLRIRGGNGLLPLDDVETSPTIAGISIDGGDHEAPAAGEKLSVSFAEGSSGTLLVVWTSSDTSVADVQPDGRVVCKKPGTTTVKARPCDASCEAQIELTVPGFDTIAWRECSITSGTAGADGEEGGTGAAAGVGGADGENGGADAHGGSAGGGADGEGDAASAAGEVQAGARDEEEREGAGALSWEAVDGARAYRVVLTPQTRGLRFMQHDIVQLETQVTQLELVDMNARQDYYFEVHPIFEEGMGNTNILAAYHRGK